MRVTFTVPLMSKGLSAAMLVWLTDNPIAQAIIKYAEIPVILFIMVN
jgi:hypothetical protein